MTTPPNPDRPTESERGGMAPDASPSISPTQPPHYPGAYGYPGYSGYPVQGPTNGFAIASLVLGILWIWWVGSILALIFGYIARNQIRQRNESGGGLAIAGIVLGWVGVGLLVIFLIFGLISLVTGG